MIQRPLLQGPSMNARDLQFPFSDDQTKRRSLAILKAIAIPASQCRSQPRIPMPYCWGTAACVRRYPGPCDVLKVIDQVPTHTNAISIRKFLQNAASHPRQSTLTPP